jgi:prepilin-type N-terminal cleavage/methylation domain-containing protein
MNRGRRAFTLIELLVVIGIIAVLLAILLPVISKVRTSATTANVTNQMHRISAAIGNYFNDFQAYPGALANKEFTPAGNLSAKLGNTSGSFANFANYTQSEDLVMALRGGFRLDSSNKLDLKPTEVGLGPMSFNTVAVAARKNAYIESIPSEFPPEPRDKTTQIPIFKQISMWKDELPGLGYVVDSEAPEFMDSYSSPRPILYLRANASAAAGNAVYNSKITPFDPSCSYDLAVIQPYLQKTVPNDDFHDPTDSTHDASKTGFTGANLDPSKKTSTGTPQRAWIVDYFSSASGSAKNAGSYLLLDAGPDRVFGTDDDIIVGAGGGQ